MDAPATDALAVASPTSDSVVMSAPVITTAVMVAPNESASTEGAPQSDSGLASDEGSEGEGLSAETTLLETEPSPVSLREKRKADDSIESDEETVVSKKPKTGASTTKERPRTRSGKAAAFKPIARSYKDCEDYDKKLIDMYAAKKSWDEIRAAWTKITGEKTATSTLPNRYQRLMNNFTIIPDADKVALIVAKQKIEKEWEGEKWSKIAKEMEQQGTALYKGAVLERQHKKMMLDAEELPPIGSTNKKKGDKAKTVADDETIVGDDE